MINITPTNIDLYVNQGSSFYKLFTVKDTSGAVLNLAGITAVTCKLKRFFQTDEVFNMFTTIVNSATGTIAISMSSGATAALRDTRYVYEIKLSDSDSTIAAFRGQVLVTPGV